MAQAFERVVLADFENEVLDFVAGGSGVELGEFHVEFAQGVDLVTDRGAALERRGDEIAGVIDREVDQCVELRITVGRSAGGVALNE